MEVSMLVTIVVALITAVIGPSILEIVKSKMKKSQELDDPMVFEMEADININEQLKVLQEKIGADRIWVTQFHNGGHFYSSGMSIKKFSIFYEVVSPGTSLVQQQFQNTPSSFFSRSLMEIYENNELEVVDMEDEDHTTYGLRDTARETGCKSLFLVCLKTPSGRFHGSVGVEFVKEANPFTEEQKEEIRSAASYISGTLATIHKSK
jgi:hypothetical protein